ncbi:hypothetical protein [Gimesia aquarii]|uniref:Uncharacterized protein n=1 Tax=Gimesia aquarii TaxID=2527964 RepID=A0A517WZY7_9PLAN|nr:hypothetical protein [Gimesia aquarii]QDU10811.1 hypothetical protein V202x_42240 [Gimesia aquarii]
MKILKSICLLIVLGLLSSLTTVHAQTPVYSFERNMTHSYLRAYHDFQLYVTDQNSNSDSDVGFNSTGDLYSSTIAALNSSGAAFTGQAGIDDYTSNQISYNPDNLQIVDIAAINQRHGLATANDPANSYLDSSYGVSGVGAHGVFLFKSDPPGAPAVPVKIRIYGSWTHNNGMVSEYSYSVYTGPSPTGPWTLQFSDQRGFPYDFQDGSGDTFTVKTIAPGTYFRVLGGTTSLFGITCNNDPNCSSKAALVQSTGNATLQVGF